MPKSSEGRLPFYMWPLTKTMTGFDHSIYYINVLLAINFISVRNHFVVFAAIARENLIKL